MNRPKVLVKVRSKRAGWYTVAVMYDATWHSLARFRVLEDAKRFSARTHRSRGVYSRVRVTG